MVSERSKITPDTYVDAHMDSTFLVPGREEMLDLVKANFPEEAKTEEETIAEKIFDPNSEANQNAMSTADAFGVEVNPPDIGQGDAPPPLEGSEEIFSQPPPEEESQFSFGNLYGQPEQKPKFTPREVDAFKTDLPLLPREMELAKKIKSPNLDDTLEAFKEINSTPELMDRFDTNGDGEFTFADMFDTSRWNNGKGITPEQDAEMTAKWVNDVTNKNFAARLGSVANNLFTNKTEFLMDGRQARLADDGFWKKFNMDNNLRAGALESAVGTLNIFEQATHFISGGRLGTAEGSRLGDKIFNTSNPESLSYLMMTPAKRNWSDRMAHEVGYWGSEGIQIAATAGLGSKATASKMVMNLPKGKRAAFMVNKFLTQGPTTGKVVKQFTKSGIKTKVIPATNRFAKGKNLALSLSKSGFLETSKGVMQRDLTYAQMVGLYEENSLVKKVFDNVAHAPVIGSQLMWAVESPIGKRLIYWVDEAGRDTAFGGTLYGAFRYVAVPGVKWSWKTTEPLRTSTVKRFWNGHPVNQKTGKDYWTVRQQKGIDEIEAGRAQLGKNIDPDNPYNDGGQTFQGRYKNDQNPGVGEGKVPETENPNGILRNKDEIDHEITSNKGSTGAVVSPLDLTIAARHGPSGPIYNKLTKAMVEDPKLRAQLDSIDPASRTVGDYGADSLRRIEEIMEGRDAGNMTPEEYWPKELLDQPIAAGSIEELDGLQKYMAEKLFVADALNSSLLSQLRDASAVAGELVGKQDIFTVDGTMQRISDNLVAGLSNVKQTRLRWSLLGERLQASGGKLDDNMLKEVESLVASRMDGLHDESTDGIRLMMDLLKKSDDPDLIDGLLDVFKVSNDIHNWTDFDAWMRQKITGGEFNGKVKTGALIRELQGVMVNSILSGPKTPLRAILGTTTNAYLNAFNEYAGALVKAPFKDDIVARKAAAAKLKGMIEILPEAWHVFKENWHAKFNADFATIRTRYSEAPTRGDQNWHLFGRWTEVNGTNGDKAAFYLANNARILNNNKLLGWSPRALAATDDTFKWLLARARSKEIGMRTALEETGEDWVKFSPELFKKAEDSHYKHLLDSEGHLDLSKDAWLNKQFKEITLTSELGGFSKKLDSLLNDTPLLKPFYLFARTGMNGINLSVKNTPLLGALHKESIDILRHQGDDFSSLMKYGIENANDLQSARNLFAGRQAVGATVVTGISGMYIAGNLTGNGPANRQLKQSWINGGWKPNHIYFGKVGFDYTSLEPFNMIFSAIADVGDNMELMGSEWAEKRLQAISFVIGRGLVGKTYMSGLDQLMQIVQMKPGAIDKAGANILNNSIPLAGMRNEFGKWINPHMKELNSDMWSSLRNRNQISEYASGTKLPIKYDILNGVPINNWNIFGRSFNAVSPIQMDIRQNSPGRRLLQESNYDLKTTTYAYGGYSFVKDNQVRSAFQSEMGKAPIEYRGRKFKNLEKALDFLAEQSDIQNSVAGMKSSINNPAKWDIDPNKYPHNTVIDLLVEQARSKAWAKINEPNHEAYPLVQRLKTEKDGLDSRTRDARKEIFEINYPSGGGFTMFPKKN